MPSLWRESLQRGGRSTKGPPRKMGAGYPAKQLGALYLQGRELHPRYGLALGVVSQLLEDVTRPLSIGTGTGMGAPAGSPPKLPRR